MSALSEETRQASPQAERPTPPSALGAALSRQIGGVAVAGWLLLGGSLLFGLWAFWNYQPNFIYDSRYYITMTLRDSGTSVPSAVDTASRVIHFPFESWYLSGDDMSWNLVKPRMLYPFLSAPFVKVLGLHAGMLVVPFLSVVGSVGLMTLMLTRLYGQRVAVPVMLLFTFAVTLYRWQDTAMTEGLTLGMMTLLVYNLPVGRVGRPRNLVMAGAAVFLLAITRQLGPVPAAMVGAPWLWVAVKQRRLRNEWFPYFVLVTVQTAIVTLAIDIFAPYDFSRILNNSTQKSGLVETAWTILKAEAVSMLTSDRVMLFFVLGAVAFLLVRFTRVESAMFLGVGSTTLFLCVGIGIPAQMRYEVNIYPVMLLCVAGLINAALPLFGGRSDAVAWSRGEPLPRPAAAPDRVALPLAGATALFLAVVIGWSATHGSSSVPAAPAGPPAAASLENHGLNRQQVLSKVPTELGVQVAVQQVKAHLTSGTPFAGVVDQRHVFRYRPLSPDAPGWDKRAADGTTTTRFDEDSPAEITAFAKALTLNGSLVENTIKVDSRVVSKSGEELTLRMKDVSGLWHTGHAVVLYGSAQNTVGIVTELIWDPTAQ